MRPICEAAERNKGPIAEAIAPWLPATGVVLEVASGTGQHALHFASRFPELLWQPSDPDLEAREAIESRRADSATANVAPPLDLDVLQCPWPLAEAQALVCVNMLHIAPWEACLALFAGAKALLSTGAPCAVYGPFSLDGGFNSEGNAEFDASLRRRDRRLGLRDVAQVVAAADAEAFELREQVAMPANNFTLVFTRR